MDHQSNQHHHCPLGLRSPRRWLAIALHAALALCIVGSASSAQEIQVLPGDGVEAFGQAVVVHDVDGDGQGEVFIGAPRHSAGSRVQVGRVVVYRSGNGDFADRRVVMIGGPAGEQFGSSLAVGDLNGDGHPDLVIGAPRWNRSRGRVLVLFGKEGGGALTAGADFYKDRANVVLEGTEELAAFGRTVACGDLDGDGIDDLIVSEPMVDGDSAKDSGRILVFPGRKRWKAGAAPINGKQNPPHLQLLGEEHEALGAALAVGDVNGDGKKDLLVGSPWFKNQSGRAMVFLGRDDLLDSPSKINLGRGERPDWELQSGTVGRLGESVALGDLGNDGVTDLLVGEPLCTPGRNKHAGAVHAIPWDPERKRLRVGPEPQEGIQSYRGQVMGEKLGSTVALVQIRGTAAPDLLLGSSDVGRVVMFQDPTDISKLKGPTRAFMPQGGQGAGAAVGVGDLRGEGTKNIVVGAPVANTVYVIQP